jgi:hypothetical protein
MGYTESYVGKVLKFDFYPDDSVTVPNLRWGKLNFHLDRRCRMPLEWLVLEVPITVFGVSKV